MAYRLFEAGSQALTYAKFRPIYPPRIKELIVSFITSNGGKFNQMVDVACGSGQSTFDMAGCFNTVHGIDISQEQVNQARKKCKELKHENVEFRTGSAEDLPFEDESMDLVTCAEALHWFDFNKFYAEVDRILKPKGVLAAYGYGFPEPKHPICGALLTHFIWDTLKGCWADRIKYIASNYRDLELPYSKSERHDFYVDTAMKLPDAIGFISSWSAYQRYCELNPGSTALSDLERDLHKELGYDVPKELVDATINYPVFILLAQKP